jgi:hypothetical protein
MKTKSLSPSDSSIQNHKLFTGTYGHIKWLTERKNKTILTGEVDMESVSEICFAYTTDPELLQKFHDDMAKKAIESFMIRMQPDDFVNIQSHAEREILKYIETLTKPVIPKKPVAAKSRTTKKTARVRKR